MNTDPFGPAPTEDLWTAEEQRAAEEDAAWGEWLEATYDPDNERLEDREV